jgi:2-C-methyl-D-erythritol 4-phosphate cytidylyltransferase
MEPERTQTPLPVYAVMVAGGQGTRMGAALPKQFLDLCGRPVLYYAIRAFVEAIPDVRMILVLPQTQLSYAQMVFQAFPDRLDLTLVAGGDTRYDSVRNGLNAIDAADGIVLVHDGVRALISPELIVRCYEGALAQGSAIPAIAVADSMRLLEDNGSSRLVDRSRLRSIQTPQAFRLSLLRPAFEQPWQEAFTDEASVLEAAGQPVHLVAGERRNIKITTPEDLLIAAALLKQE